MVRDDNTSTNYMNQAKPKRCVIT